MIPPKQSSAFVAQMEQVLDIYKLPYDEYHPVVCMDESPKQLIAETKTPLPMRAGSSAKFDYEYKRCGVCNIFMASEPLSGKRITKVTPRRTKQDWAYFIEELADRYSQAEKITLVMDNLNTHNPSSLYETFTPEKAKKIWDRFNFIYTPKHGSWLNMAEIEIGIMNRQCLNRRIDNMGIIEKQIGAWTASRNNYKSKINWQFTSEDSRIKLKRLYPTLEY